jgi:predicted lipoprotein with Yx(FWY)xxD motif
MTRRTLQMTGLSGILLIVLSAVLSGCTSSRNAIESYAVTAIDVPGPGKVVADGAGYTLYIYAPDNQGPSRCTSVCAEQWPPLLLPQGVFRPVAGGGINAALLGTTRRVNGSLQVTYNGWPLYTYIDDGRGQVTGQGEGMGAWYLLSVTGSVDHLPLTGTDS